MAPDAQNDRTPESLLVATLSEAGGPLGGLAVLAQYRSMIEDLTHLYARRARSFGHSWVEIGQALGISPQAAGQRFGRRPSEH
jgi:hypothetical protein